MRKTMTGLAAVVAVMTVSAMPAMACVNPCASTCGGGLLTAFSGGGCGGGYSYGGGYGYTGYSLGYGAGYGYSTGYVPSYNTGCCGSSYAYTLPTQYYYVNQGPTYTGPGAYAPYPAYRERSYSYGYDGGPYANPVNYNYEGGYDTGPQVIRYRPRYYTGYRPSYRYGYGYRPAPRTYFARPIYRAAPRYHAYAPRPQWHHRPILRRYN